MRSGLLHINTRPIVAAIDASQHSRAVVAWAVEEARSRDASLQVVICQPAYAEVRAFGAGPTVHGVDPIDLALVRDEAIRVVDDVRLRGDADPRGLDIDVRGHAGPPAEHLVALSENALLLVVGSRGSGGRSHGALLGSVVTAVTRHAKCPVVVIP